MTLGTIHGIILTIILGIAHGITGHITARGIIQVGMDGMVVGIMVDITIITGHTTTQAIITTGMAETPIIVLVEMDIQIQDIHQAAQVAPLPVEVQERDTLPEEIITQPMREEHLPVV